MKLLNFTAALDRDLCFQVFVDKLFELVVEGQLFLFAPNRLAWPTSPMARALCRRFTQS
jgi:hypothetical protein